MMNRNASEKIIKLMEEVAERLHSAAGLIEQNSDEDEHETYLATIEYVLGYLRQDVMKPVIDNYPDLAPDDWE